MASYRAKIYYEIKNNKGCVLISSTLDCVSFSDFMKSITSFIEREYGVGKYGVCFGIIHPGINAHVRGEFKVVVGQ